MSFKLRKDRVYEVKNLNLRVEEYQVIIPKPKERQIKTREGEENCNQEETKKMKKFVFDSKENREAEINILKNIIERELEPRGSADLSILSDLPIQCVRIHLIELIRMLEMTPDSLFSGVDIQDLDEKQLCQLLKVMYENEDEN